MAPETQPSDVFIAWSCAQDYNAFSDDFRRSCEKHLRKTEAQIADLQGPAAVEGIILFDSIERGMAIATLLAQGAKTLPMSCDGASCDSHFDEDELCAQTNAHGLVAALHAGSRAMLVRPNADPDRRFILLDQREAAHLHPMGRSKNPDRAIAATGLLAHELRHARDYADGRPALAARDAIAELCNLDHAEALHLIADMATAEYVATRAECAAQVALHAGCSIDLTNRIRMMGQRSPQIPSLGGSQPDEELAAQQRNMDLSAAGYFLGTMSAYVQAAAPILNKDGSRSDCTTADMVRDSSPASSPLTRIIHRLAPELENATQAPNVASRASLVKSLEQEILKHHIPCQQRDAARSGRSGKDGFCR